MNCIERLNTLPATAQEKKWLEERLATISEKESLVLDAAILRSPPESASEAINHLLRLEDYEVCCPVGSYEELGRFYLRSETTLSESLYPFTDLNQLGRNYENAHPGLFVRNAYVCYPTEEPDFHYVSSRQQESTVHHGHCHVHQHTRLHSTIHIIHTLHAPLIYQLGLLVY